jgi:hypothetical protein
MKNTSMKVLYVAGVALIYLVMLLMFHFLQFPLQADETHFWPTTLYLFQDGFPSLDRLRSYNELNTPLPFLVFGAIEYYFHFGVVAGRAVNLLTSVFVVYLVAAAGQFSYRAALCALGLMLCPYFFAVSTHLYTDIICIAFVVLGMDLYLKSRVIVAAVSFALAIACRQYAVAFPIGIFLYDCINALFANKAMKKVLISITAAALASATLGGWWLFFGAMAPRVAISDQHIAVGHLFPAHGLYFLSCIGIYFVLVETVLFRSVDELTRVTAPKLLLAGITSVCFLLFPPIGNLDQYIQSMGFMDKAVRLVTPDTGRVIIFWGLAMLTCIRFAPLSLPGILIYLNAGLMVAAHVAWDKYALPMIAVLWLLKASDRFETEKLNIFAKVSFRRDAIEPAVRPAAFEVFGL